jgi:transposase-like protein
MQKEKYKQNCIPKCPICGLTNIKRVSGTSKAVNAAMFGLFAVKWHKTFLCNNCGYEW